MTTLKINRMPVHLKQVTLPAFGELSEQPKIPAAIYEARANAAYDRAGADWLAVYADREHFGNIVFLSGFEPRFEEAFLLLGPRGKRVLITGNESESYAVIARLPGLTVLRSQSLSLMAQDRTLQPRLIDRLRDAGIEPGDTVGLVGWKYLEPEEDDNYASGFFVPAVYVQMFERLIGSREALRDATPILMHPETGLRAMIAADQIAAFEWAATRCSLALWRIVSGVREGDSEFSAVARTSNSEVIDTFGTKKLGIENMPPLITRGILIDVAGFKGVENLEAGYAIQPNELDQAIGQWRFSYIADTRFAKS